MQMWREQMIIKTNSDKYRLCEVKGEIGYFHGWEEIYDVISPSPMIGGHPGGQVSRTYGIVEFPNRIEEVIPSQIKFRDKTSGELKHITQAIKDMKL